MKILILYILLSPFVLFSNQIKINKDLGLDAIHEMLHLIGLADSYDWSEADGKSVHDGYDGYAMGGERDEWNCIQLHQNNINSLIQAGIEIENNPDNTVKLANGKDAQSIYNSMDGSAEYLDNNDTTKKPAEIEGY